jgi:hypothetical protein
LHIPLLYREGRSKAFIQLLREINIASAHRSDVKPSEPTVDPLSDKDRNSMPLDSTVSLPVLGTLVKGNSINTNTNTAYPNFQLPSIDKQSHNATGEVANFERAKMRM